MLHYLRLLIQVMLAPGNGWEDIDRERPDQHTMLFTGFLPLCVISALSVLFQLVYHPYLHLIFLVEKAVIQLVAVFITCYIAEFFFSLYQIHNIGGSLVMSRVRVYLMVTLSELALMLLVINLVPFSPVLMLLPLYVIVVMRMAVPYLGVLENRIGNFMVLSIATVFVPPLLIMFLFGYLTRQIA